MRDRFMHQQLAVTFEDLRTAQRITCRKAEVTEAQASVSAGSLGSPWSWWLHKCTKSSKLTRISSPYHTPSREYSKP